MATMFYDLYDSTPLEEDNSKETRLIEAQEAADKKAEARKSEARREKAEA